MRNTGWFAMLFASIMALQTLAMAPSAAATVAPADVMRVIRAADDDATRASAARLQAAAEAGDSFAMYDIGSLHRQPGRKGAAVFAYDPGKALMWLTRAFNAGRLGAAYKIALTYAAIGDDMEAAGWASVYAHYLRPYEAANDAPNPLRVNLMNDLQTRIGRGREEAVDARRMTLLDKHSARFEAARKQPAAAHPQVIEAGDACTHAVPANGYGAELALPTDVLVEYVVQIQPNGRPGTFAVLDAASQAIADRAVQSLVERMNCKPRNAERYAIQSFQLQSGPRLRQNED